MKVKYKDKVFEYETDVELSVIANEVKKDYKKNIIVGSINNILSSLDTVISRDCEVDFFDITSLYGNRTYERGLYFLFSKAVKDILNCDVKIMHVMNKGVYCEILSNNIISEVTLEKIKLRMDDLVKEELPIEKIVVSRLETIDYYKKINQLDKASSLRYISNSSISLYKLDDTLDYFYGILPNNTKLIDTYKLKFIKENKIMLFYPYLYDMDSELKYIKNDQLLEVINENDKYLESMKINTAPDLNQIISRGNYADVIRISESLLNSKLLNVVSKISKDKDIKMILITGPSSSGKTTIAKKLTLFLRSLGYNPIPISVDDFYKNIEERELDEQGNIERERISAFDTNLFNNKVDELLNGKEVTMPKFNFQLDKRQWQDEKVKMGEKSILVVEGIQSFNDKLTEIIPDKNKFKIFVSPFTPLNIDNHNLFRSTDNRLLRRIVRDNKQRNKSASETLKAWRQVRKIEEEIILPYVNEADEIINTSLAYELGVLKTYAEPLLFSVNEDDENYDEALRLINLFRIILGMPSDSVPEDSIIREFIGGSCFEK